MFICRRTTRLLIDKIHEVTLNDSLSLQFILRS